MHIDAGRHQPGHQGIFDGGGIGAEIVSRHQFQRHMHLMQQRTKAHTQRLHAHQVDFLAKQPARVIFAKTGGLDHGAGFIGSRIGNKLGQGNGKHDSASCQREALCIALPEPKKSRRYCQRLLFQAQAPVADLNGRNFAQKAHAQQAFRHRTFGHDDGFDILHFNCAKFDRF